MNVLKHRSVVLPEEKLSYEEWRTMLGVSTLYHAKSIIERVNRDDVEMYGKDFQTTYFEQTKRHSLLSRFIHKFKKEQTGQPDPEISLAKNNK